MASLDFEFTFPSYILGAIANIDPATGKTEFRTVLAPRVNGQQAVALFTNRAIADTHLEATPDSQTSLCPIEIATPAEFVAFLDEVSATHSLIAVDLHRETKAGRVYSIGSLLEQLRS